MKTIPFVTATIALAALLAFAAPSAEAQGRPVGGGPRIILPSHSNHFSREGKHGGFHGVGGGVFVIEREVPVIVEKEVVREKPAESVAAAAPEPPMKPYVLGRNYGSLPGACMKMIEGGASYYYCSGEWYRQVREGRSPLYKAVARP